MARGEIFVQAMTDPVRALHPTDAAMLRIIRIVSSLAVLLCTLACTPALAAKRSALSNRVWQISPAMNLANLFPDADRISLGVVVVPDPLVPRYRRLYDLDLVAIELG